MCLRGGKDLLLLLRISAAAHRALEGSGPGGQAGWVQQHRSRVGHVGVGQDDVDMAGLVSPTNYIKIFVEHDLRLWADAHVAPAGSYV